MNKRLQILNFWFYWSSIEVLSIKSSCIWSAGKQLRIIWPIWFSPNSLIWLTISCKARFNVVKSESIAFVLFLLFGIFLALLDFQFWFSRTFARFLRIFIWALIPHTVLLSFHMILKFVSCLLNFLCFLFFLRYSLLLNLCFFILLLFSRILFLLFRFFYLIFLFLILHLSLVALFFGDALILLESILLLTAVLGNCIIIVL